MPALAAPTSFNTALPVAGITALYLGTGAFVEGASWLAIGLGLWTTIVGVIIVTFAMTVPEFFVAALSDLGYSSDLGLDAIVGSSIANIGLVLGISAFIEPMSVSTATLRRYVPSMIAAAVVLVTLGMDGDLSVIDGGVLLLILIVFTGYLLHRTWSVTADTIGTGEIDIEDEDEVSTQFKNVAHLTFGLLLLFIGSNWLIRGGQGLLESFGFGSRLAGLTVLVFGTSLPELAVSVINAVRGKSGLSIGNVAGPDIYNVVTVLDILAIMVPISIPPSTISLGSPALLVFTSGIIAPMLRNHDAPRLDGDILVIGYLVFFWLILP